MIENLKIDTDIKDSVVILNDIEPEQHLLALRTTSAHSQRTLQEEMNINEGRNNSDQQKGDTQCQLSNNGNKAANYILIGRLTDIHFPEEVGKR